MGAKSGIEWTDATWNPVRARLKSGSAVADDARDLAAGVSKPGWHCEHVSEGCRNCYAEGINKRLGTKLDFKPGHIGKIDIFLDGKLLTDPLRWKRPRSVFVSSMTDVFADFVSDEMLDRMFAVMALCPQHFFRVLTKRPGRMRDYVSEAGTPGRIARAILDMIIMDNRLAALMGRDGWPVASIGGDIDLPDDVTLARWPLPNVGLGVSVEDQASADARIPLLLDTRAAMRFVSAEPLLGGLDIRKYLRRLCDRCPPWEVPCQTGCEHYTRLDEVIAGGESGAQARPMHPEWARGLRDQCAAAGVPFFFKQWGEWRLRPAADGSEEWPAQWFGATPPKEGEIARMERVGKSAAGALLGGREHREVAAQVRAHFERIGRAPAPNRLQRFDPPQGEGGMEEGEAG